MTPSRTAAVAAVAALVVAAAALGLALGNRDEAASAPVDPPVSISAAPGFGAAEAIPIVSREPGAAGEAGAGGGITVTGTAVAETTPDRSSWSFGVQTEGATAREALDQASERARSLVAALRREGVEEDSLRTEQVSVWPQYGNGSRVTGYTASTSVHAVVVGLDRAGRVVDAAVDAGANNVSGPGLATGDRDRLYRQALAAAVEQARATAQVLAQEAGLQLGGIVAIRESGGAAPPMPVAEAAVAADARGGVPVEGGKLQVNAAATVTFAIGGGDAAP
jgi:uncharacterized protein